MSASLSCPYCNALVPAPVGVQAGQMITCPRCDDRFRVLADAVPATTDTSPPPAAAPIVPPVFRRSNRFVAMVVLGVMVVMAMSGLTLALLTQGKRREHDKGIPGRAKRPRQLEVELPAKVAPTAPLELAALHYLPADCDVLLGVHVAEVLQEPAGRELLKLELPGLGAVEQSLLQKVERLTGLAMLEVDHLVLAARVNHKVIPPRLLIVVRTRSPYDQDRVRDRLRATAHPKAAGRPLYRFQKELLPLYDTGVLACPDEHTLVLGWQVLDLADMTVSRPDSGHLNKEIRALVAERMKPTGPAWLAAHSDNWPEALGLLLEALKLKGIEKAALAKLRTFAVWLELDEKKTARAVVRCVDAAGAEAVEKALRDRLATDSLTLFREDGWLTLQYRP